MEFRRVLFRSACARNDADSRGATGRDLADLGDDQRRSVPPRAPARVRPEERRVGKERRSRGWSSDVCSSDLPAPGTTQTPVAPLAGTWQTWVTTSGDQFRPAPPPE